ncbi:MAG: CBS domain-containing protein [Propionibacteriaceae bacterium]|nr:CBS domain-containing protein [Propionibacteriaceae bacterium]
MGSVRDVVVRVRNASRPPRVKGLVMELFARRRVYVPIERVYAIDPSQVVVSGAVNARRFRRREGETLIVEDLIDRQVVRRGDSVATRLYDVSIAPGRAGEWEVSQVALAPLSGRPFRGPPALTLARWNEVPSLSPDQPEAGQSQITELLDLRPADIARQLHDMDPGRRLEVVAALDDRRLAEALEQLPDDEQVDLISVLDPERAADVLEEMDPDDAADLVADLPTDKAEGLLTRMRPEDAQDVRDLLLYEEETAGGMMTPEPVILPPDATAADALARVREEELPPALAAMVYVCRPPVEAPTGRYLGAVHTQRLLREPPSTLVSAILDAELAPLSPYAHLADVSRYFATYDMVAAPVVDGNGRLVGAVTVDDVLDHMLPEDWRGSQLDGDMPRR